jgi:predicted metalloprotease
MLKAIWAVWHHMSYKIPNLGEIYDKIDSEQRIPMSQEDSYLWGLDYLKDIQRQLLRLEKKAIEQNNPMLYQNVRLSMQRSEEALAELESKIRQLRK